MLSVHRGPLFVDAWGALWGRVGGSGVDECFYVDNTMDQELTELVEEEDNYVCFFKGYYY